MGNHTLQRTRFRSCPWLPLATLLLAFPGSARADDDDVDVDVEADFDIEEGPVSLGVGLGDPTAIDVKFWTANSHGLNLGVGVDDFDNRLGVYAEFEFGLVEFMTRRALGVFYLGLGGALAVHANDVDLAAIVPIGLDFRFRIPLDLYVEARPGIDFDGHDPAFGAGAQLGLRYVF